MTKTEQYFYDQLKDMDNIIFGPSVGDFGWEIAIISGFVKKYKEDHPNKKVGIITRENRRELYIGSNLDYVFGFNIPSDYEEHTPRTFGLCKTPQNKAQHTNQQLNLDGFFQAIKAQIQNSFGHFSFVSFDRLPFMQEPDFNLKEYDYNFQIDTTAANSISEIKERYKDKELVTIFSRHRIDLTHRNWDKGNWFKLFNKLNETYKDKYIFLISGTDPSYIKPNKSNYNFIDLNDLEGDQLALTIESIRNSKFTFGPQTAGIILSNVLKTPNTYFGTEEQLVSNSYNPFNTLSKIIHVESNRDHSYKMNYMNMLNQIKNFEKEL